jgi:hypothetical protein
MSRQDFPIDGKTQLRDGAIPDFVIPLSVAFKMAAVFRKDFLTIGA